MTPDVHALTGAYVLDAVPELERAAFERHLAECDACTQEVRELRETATRLGRAAAADPPPHLKPQVMSRISQVRQLPPEHTTWSGPVPRTRNWPLRVSTAAAAALLVVAGVLGGLLIRERGALDDSRQYADSLSGILRSDDAKVASGPVSSGGSATVVLSRSQDRGLVLASGMPALEGGKVYEAWLVDPAGTMHPAGLLPGAGSAVLDLKNVSAATGFGLTVEPSGGSQSPTLPPIMQVSLPTA